MTKNDMNISRIERVEETKKATLCQTVVAFLY